MKKHINMTDTNGHPSIFSGNAKRGTLFCRDIVPLSIAAHLNGYKLGQVVAIEDPAGKWLESATIVSADSSPDGTTFQLAY